MLEIELTKSRSRINLQNITILQLVSDYAKEKVRIEVTLIFSPIDLKIKRITFHGRFRE